MIVGYARVSTREQCLSGQLAELRAAGCAKVYSEKASGARGDRAELRKVVDRLQPGDVLVVTRLDRLARSTRDLLNVLESVRQAGGGFRSIKDAWADTTTPHGQLMLTILGGLAECRCGSGTHVRGGPRNRVSSEAVANSGVASPRMAKWCQSDQGSETVAETPRGKAARTREAVQH
jgi:Resolvase, N terminal domain